MARQEAIGGGEESHSLPILSTLPAANATTVRPDTRVTIQLDTSVRHFEEWSRRLAREAKLVLLDDGGKAVFEIGEDNELTYEPSSGTLTFVPPALLDRYTTYGVVVVAEELPEFLRPKRDEDRRALPHRPEFTVQAVDPSSLVLASGAPAPGAGQAERVGPPPVRALDAAKRAIDRKEGGDQKGVIERIEGSLVTLFGGRQFSVGDDTRIHIPELPHRGTLADLHPGDLVEVSVDDGSRVLEIGVLDRDEVFSFVFRTGSALHEPTMVQLQVADSSPRVTEDGHFALLSSDDYGLPAWGSVTSIELKAENGATLDSSAKVLPSNAFTTTDPSGRTDVTVVDHVPQVVTAKISMNGPYTDGYDGHGLVVTFGFRPGLPANATLSAPAAMVVGTTADLSGAVTDAFGNSVEDASALLLTSTAGTVDSPVYTVGGHYHASYTAATRVQDVTISLTSAAGSAVASGGIHLLPGDPYSMTLQGPAVLQAGSGTSLSGTVLDQYGNRVLDGSQLVVSATAGAVTASAVTTAGNYSIAYGAPTKVQSVQVAAASVTGSASAILTIAIIPGPPAELMLQAQQTSLYTGSMTGLGGQVADQYGNLIGGQQIAMAAQQGTLSNSAPVSDAAGLYNSLYTAPFYDGVDTVTASAGTVQASVSLTISSAGSGIDPSTGQVEPVASLTFDRASYNASPGQAIVLDGHAYDGAGKPLESVVFSSQSATVGTIISTSYQTDASGRFTVTYLPPQSQATATLSLSSRSVTATATVNTLAYGYGYDAQAGQWVRVSAITLAVSSLHALAAQANSQYSVSVLPGAAVALTGTVYSADNHPLSQVMFDTLTATAGSAQVSGPTDSNGQFTLQYKAPTVQGNQLVQIGSGPVVTNLVANVTTLGYGFNPASGAWEPVASITFDQGAYTLYAGNAVQLTGHVRNASGVALTNAPVLFTASAGSVPTQALTQSPDGRFSASYTAPSTAGNYTVRAYVNNNVAGTATVNVQPVPNPYLLGAYINLYGSAYGSQFQGTAYWGGRAMNGDGTPMSYGNGFQIEAILQPGTFTTPLAATYPDANGMIYGPPVPITLYAAYYSIGPYGGITYYFYIYLDMALWNGAHYQGLAYGKMFNMQSYVF